MRILNTLLIPLLLSGITQTAVGFGGGFGDDTAIGVPGGVPGGIPTPPPQVIEIVDRDDSEVPDSGDGTDIDLEVPSNDPPPQFPRSASGSVSDRRCAGDSLSPAQSRERLMWAGDNNIIPRELIVKWLYSVKNNKVVMNARPYYPMFGTWNGNPNQSKIWKPENHGMPAKVPHPYTWIAICRSSCYTPDQNLHTDIGPMPIGEAEQNQYSSIMTVDDSSTLHSLQYKSSQVEKYTASFQDTLHIILNFATESGRTISVTPNHPLVDDQGMMREAITFGQGDHFVTDEGALDPIVSLVPSFYWGKVYNVRPVNTDRISNIVVVEGLLNGSDRYQNEYFDLINDQVLSNQIDEALLP